MLLSALASLFSFINCLTKNLSLHLQLVFYDDEQYAERLIGNGFSIPLMDILLRPLKEKFGKKVYPDYVYDFKWNGSPCS
jgi:hypothetical protein